LEYFSVPTMFLTLTIIRISTCIRMYERWTFAPFYLRCDMTFAPQKYNPFAPHFHTNIIFSIGHLRHRVLSKK